MHKRAQSKYHGLLSLSLSLFSYPAVFCCLCSVFICTLCYLYRLINITQLHCFLNFGNICQQSEPEHELNLILPTL